MTIRRCAAVILLPIPIGGAWNGEEATGNPASFGVQAGTEVIALVGIPWNSTASETFVVEISMVPR